MLGAKLRVGRFVKMMRSTAVAILFALGLCGPGLAQGLGGMPLVTGATAFAQTARGRVTTIDSVTMNFSCRDRAGDHLYWVTRATRFWASHPNATFSDVKTGERVEVISHHTGNQDIADIVVL
jgi:hypothetical protein